MTTNSLIVAYHETPFGHKSRQCAVDRVTKVLARFPKSVGIACTGISGILVAVPAAEKTNREFVIIRKPGEQKHSSNTVEGYNLKEYVIVDDFIDYGKTVKRIVREMKNRTRWGQSYPAQCRGVILYDGIDNKVRLEYPKGNHIPIFQCLTNNK